MTMVDKYHDRVLKIITAYCRDCGAEFKKEPSSRQYRCRACQDLANDKNHTDSKERQKTAARVWLSADVMPDFLYFGSCSLNACHFGKDAADCRELVRLGIAPACFINDRIICRRPYDDGLVSNGIVGDAHLCGVEVEA